MENLSKPSFIISWTSKSHETAVSCQDVELRQVMVITAEILRRIRIVWALLFLLIFKLSRRCPLQWFNSRFYRTRSIRNRRFLHQKDLEWRAFTKDMTISLKSLINWVLTRQSRNDYSQIYAIYFMIQKTWPNKKPIKTSTILYKLPRPA